MSMRKILLALLVLSGCCLDPGSWRDAVTITEHYIYNNFVDYSPLFWGPVSDIPCGDRTCQRVLVTLRDGRTESQVLVTYVDRGKVIYSGFFDKPLP